MSNNSLTIALTHAIAFLTSPLIPHHSPKTIDILHASLESNLTALFAPTWSTTSSTSRVLNLAPGRLPPAAVWRAGTKAGIQWSEWITALGGFEFDLFVDPGVVAFRIGAWGGVHVIWQEEAVVSSSNAGGRPATIGSGMRMKKTLAQTIVDDEENAIFSMIDDERAEPTWLTPILDKFPRIPPPPSFASQQHLPISSSSSTSSFYHTTSNNNNNSSFVFPPIPFPISRPSSRSSSTSSANSLFSFSDCDSLSSVSSRSSFEYNNNQFAEKQQQQQRTTTTRSRRQHRPKLSTEIFIDPSKKEVTNYDGGKTTVLTGGVMLGGGPAPVKANNNVNNANVNGNSTNWRRTRW